jgi:hypothetical protein
MLGERIAAHMRVFAGDCVPKKKPAPDIYNLAAQVGRGWVAGLCAVRRLVSSCAVWRWPISWCCAALWLLASRWPGSL